MPASPWQSMKSADARHSAANIRMTIHPIEQAALRTLQTDLLEQYLVQLKERRGTWIAPLLLCDNVTEVTAKMGYTT